MHGRNLRTEERKQGDGLRTRRVHSDHRKMSNSKEYISPSPNVISPKHQLYAQYVSYAVVYVQKSMKDAERRAKNKQIPNKHPTQMHPSNLYGKSPRSRRNLNPFIKDYTSHSKQQCHPYPKQTDQPGSPSSCAGETWHPTPAPRNQTR